MMLTTSGTYDDEEGAVLVLAGCDDVYVDGDLYPNPPGPGARDDGNSAER